MSNSPAIVQHQVALQAAEFQQELTTSNHFKMNVAREVTFALQALEASPYLASATPESIKKAVLNVALTGLTLNPVLNQAYLVPRRKDGKLVAVLDPSYQGLITKIIDSGVASKVVAQVVHENDQFDFDESTDSMLAPHKKWYILGKQESGAEIGAYAGIQHPNGTWQYKFLPIHRVNQIMEMSESYKAYRKDNTKGSIWVTHREEMVKKTAVKYLWKYLPKSDRLEYIGRAIEESNFAHEMTETVHTETGATVKTSSNPSITANALSKVRKPVSRVERKASAEVIEVEAQEENAEESSSIHHLFQKLEQSYDIAQGEERQDEQASDVANLILSFSGFTQDEITAFVSAKSKSFKTFDDVVFKATPKQIYIILTSMKQNA